MLDTQIRVEMVECRVAALRRKRERRMTTILTVLSSIITVCLAMVAGELVDERQSHVPGLYGSTMLSEEAGGYVLVGVLSFCAAVVITVLCTRYRDKKKTRK